MRRMVLMLLALAVLGACSEDQPASKAPVAKAPAPTAPVAATTNESSAGGLPAIVVDDEPVKYDPIDVSKLDSQWWKQYNGDG